MAFVLSTYKEVGTVCSKFSLERKPRSQVVSDHAEDIAQYSNQEIEKPVNQMEQVCSVQRKTG